MVRNHARSDFVSDETCALTNRRRHRQILIALIATPLLLVLGALLTSNQISEQLALSGGIEPLGHPGAIALAAGVIVGAAMSINRLHYGLLLVSVIVTLYVVGLATYTMRKVNYVSYYPTKIGLSGAVLLTVVAVVIFGASVNQTEQTKVHRRATTFASFVAFGVTVAPMSSLWWSSSSFKQTYMGSGTAFAKGLISGSVGSFDSTLVLAAYQKSQETGRPVVFLEPADSNTLMSYWVNNMTRQTSFRVYGAWFQAVRSINSQDYEGAALRIQDQSLLPVALSLDMVNAIRLAGADEVCLWEPTELVCSSK